MKRFLKISAFAILFIVGVGLVFYIFNNEKLPEGKEGKEADALAIKMFNALNHDAFDKTEIIEWSFRDSHFYKWYKSKNIVEVKWSDNKVILNTLNPMTSEVFINDKKEVNKELIKTAEKYFNNDSFWLVAPYKIFDSGTERRIVEHENKDALLITYTSGGSTPGDSYLWILNENYIPTSFKMWTSIIPIGGVSGSWSDWKVTESGIKLPTKHILSLFGMEINMGEVKAYNEEANKLAKKILKAVKHENYKKTRFIEWSFAGRRTFKWDKEEHIVDITWDAFKVKLHPENKELSKVLEKPDNYEKTNKEIIQNAWNIFNNDSFWLVAPHKLFDNGVIRNLENEEGMTSLRVTYTSGGTTPGDSYVWILDENYIPKSYKMYLKNGRMNGTQATWEEWITTESGTLLPKNHAFTNGAKLSMGEVKGYN